MKRLKEFRALARKELVDPFQSRRSDDDEAPLTTREFLRLLGNPLSLALRFNHADFVYEMGGYSEELFGDVTAERALKDG